MARGPTIPMYKRMLTILVLIIVLGFVPLSGRLFQLQILDYQYYQAKAINQQTRDIQISPNRGTIYDCNMKPLAISSTCFMVIISPRSIKNDEQREKIASGLSEILGADKAKILTQSKKNTFYEIVARRIENDAANKVRDFIKTNKFSSCISLAEDPKRLYPFDNFASHLIGFTGSDNQGLSGLEAKYDSYLKGVPGRIISARNAQGTDMPFEYEKNIDAQDGNNLVLTIDEVIQHFLEKHLETAVIENKVNNRAAGIIMNVKTGEILAMAVKPDFNLNDPFTITDTNLLSRLKGLTGDELKAKTTTVLNEMWRNKAITEQYEPGSTFKIFTAATAIEENLVNDKETFVCNGYRVVGGRKIHCAKVTGHGVETFLQGLENSCNPVFMDIGARIGTSRFIKYFNAFGFTKKTNIDLPGEAVGIFHKEENFKEVELATASFGQRFNITPIQLITAVASVANGGKLLEPHVVKEITDSKGNTVKSFQTKTVRQVISEASAKKLCSMLESVVANGSGRNAYIKGFRIAGKTGTSEKFISDTPDNGVEKRISSFVGFAPADDPEIVCLVLFDEPQVSVKFGSVIVAPVVGSILSDVLPYIGVEPQYTAEELAQMDVSVPNVTGLSVSDAKKKLSALKLDTRVIGGDGTVTSQLPAGGQKIPYTGTVLLYTNNKKPDQKVAVPDVTKCTASAANDKLINAGLNIRIIGKDVYKAGTLSYSQSPKAGEMVTPGTVVSVEFRIVNDIAED